jgi:hypothetical protein
MHPLISLKNYRKRRLILYLYLMNSLLDERRSSGNNKKIFMVRNKNIFAKEISNM